MRIIGGRYKGHQLVNFKADHIRPTTDRVKETVFNILMADIEGAIVLDLFAGTGNLGFEALSRGANEVTFVEKNKKSLKIIQQNIDKLKIKEKYQIIPLDVFRLLEKQEREFDVIFIDPPFTQKIAHDVMIAVSKSKIFHENSIIAIESSSSEKMEDYYGQLFRFKIKNFGDKILSIFEFQEKRGG